MSGKRFGGPPVPESWGHQPIHYSVRGSVAGICGKLAPRRTQRDTHITCEGCLRARLTMLGVAFADRALTRMAPEPEDRFTLLRRALAAAKRLAVWRAKREAGKRRA